MFYLQIAILCMAVVHVICDLPPGTRRNTYLPPEPTKGYTYDTPRIPFTKPTTPRPSFPTTTPYSSRPYPKPTPSKFPPSRTTPSEGYPPTGTRPTPEFPDYGTPTRPTGTTLPAGGHDHHHHEPGMPFDFNYAVKEDAFGNDYSHNAISDGDIVRGEYRVQLPDGRLQVVRYTADWKHGFSAQVSYDGNPRFDVPRPPGNFAGMTLPLSRTDYAAVGVTSKGTTKVFPATEHRQTQKFAVADHNGVLHVYGIKKGELQVSFKSLPGPRINKLVLGGTGHDKIYIAQGNTVKGYTKKGKLFLEFDTNLIDPISALYVLGPNLAACARDLYHRYHDCKDADSYLAGETLYDIVLLPTDGNFMFAILACGDCAIRVLHGTKTPAILRLPSVPTVLSLYREGDLESKERVLVGTIDGKVGLLILHGNKTLRITWLLNMTGSEVTSLDTYELQDGLDILIGRQDGTVEVYTFPEEDTLPFLRYRYNAKESISSVVGGIIGAAGYPEVLVTTYSGRIFGLTTKPPGLLEANQNDGLTKLKAEIEQLQEKLKEEKEAASFSVDPLAPLILSVNHRMILNREDASYSLSIELDTPIDNILIQSDTPIELLDVESNSAVVSLSTCNPREGNFVLATYRCQVNTNHLEMRLRTIEGQPGTLQIYVTSQVQPKCCRKISIPISALSLHVRQHEADNSETHVEGPFNELKLIGGFTVAEMHAWLSFALSDVPERPHLEEGEATLTYVSSFIGTLLKCKYKKGSAIFLGENISSIIILRDILTREATKRKIKLDVFCDVSDGSISRVLELIFPQLNAAHDLVTKVKILNALEEWELKENPKENLCSEYQELIQKESEIKSQMAKDNEILERLHAVITDLYVDWERAKRSRRIGSKDVAEKLSAALKSRELAQVLQAFIDTSNTVSPPSSYKD